MKDYSCLNPRVSIIIPVFNDADGVTHCLRRIAAQTYPITNLEVIVVDNGSMPPLTLEENFPFHIHILQQEIPGSYAARNSGAAIARGALLAFIDADCWPDEDWLLHGIETLVAGHGNWVVGGEVSIMKPEKRTSVALYQYTTGFGQESNIREKGFSATANLFCTRHQFEVIGPFETRLLSGGDREWCWRAKKFDIQVHYEYKAVVHTMPRSSVDGAIRQARRVAAGRISLEQLKLAHAGQQALAKKRSSWQSAAWILSRQELRPTERLRVLWVAIVIRMATAIEGLRLRFGSAAERR